MTVQSQSIKHLNKALRLSKSSEETYREIIRLFSKDKKLTTLMNNYCMSYFNNFGGGAVDRIGAQDEQNFLWAVTQFLLFLEMKTTLN